MKKVAVLVSGGGTNLQALIDRGIRGGEIARVISSKEGAGALERARKAGIQTVTVPRMMMSRDEFEGGLSLALQGMDLVVLAGFMCVLSRDFVRKFENRMINVHPSLIPAFCGDGFYGLHVHEAALARGVKLTGATVHFVNEITDGGPIILQKAVPVEAGDTPQTLQRRVMEQAEWELLPEAVSLFCEGRLRVTDGAVQIG